MFLTKQEMQFETPFAPVVEISLLLWNTEWVSIPKANALATEQML